MSGFTTSVVMATYNGARFLEEQLDTIRTQTIPPDELIILDDRSTDETVAVAQEYITKYDLTDKWQVHVNGKNLGYASNFNKVASMATKDLIFFSDQDDTWSLDKIEIMTGIMEKNLECKVLCTDYYPWYVGENAPEAPKSVLERMPNNGVLEKVVLSKRSLYIGAIGCCMCVRREFYNSIEKYWFDGWAQDDRMWKLSQCADGCMLLHSNLIKHRIHANNTSTYGKYHTVERRVKLFEDMLNAEKQMLEYLGDLEDSAESRDAKSIYKTIVDKHIKMMQLRIDLLAKKRILNSIPLLSYLGYYEKKKSFLLESYMVIKTK